MTIDRSSAGDCLTVLTAVSAAACVTADGRTDRQTDRQTAVQVCCNCSCLQDVKTMEDHVTIRLITLTVYLAQLTSKLASNPSGFCGS